MGCIFEDYFKPFTMKLILRFLLFVFAFLSVQNNSAQEVRLRIHNIKTTTGVLRIGIFDSEESFKSEKSHLFIKSKKSAMVNDELIVDLKLQPGTYGISVLDDENDDGKMNWKYLTIPREGFGFADYYHTGLKKPRFHNFSFSIDRDEKKCMVVKMRYF
jgi:uncharacterized protein (DUF2141 family)